MVSDNSGASDGEVEIVGDPLSPFGDRSIAWELIVAAVQFDKVKSLGIRFQVIRSWNLEICPASCSDEKLRHI